MKALLVALLMVLAVSPLTAPFSVHTPADAIGDMAWASPKKAADDLKADGIPPVDVTVPVDGRAAPTPALALTPVSTFSLHSFPLRI